MEYFRKDTCLGVSSTLKIRPLQSGHSFKLKLFLFDCIVGLKKRSSISLLTVMGCSETKYSESSSLIYPIWKAVFSAITEIDSKTLWTLFYVHKTDESWTPVDVQAIVHCRRMSTGEMQNTLLLHNSLEKTGESWRGGGTRAQIPWGRNRTSKFSVHRNALTC